MAEETVVWFNPRCSKCVGAEQLLADLGVGATFVRYLDEAPTPGELRRVMVQLGIDDPRQMMRTGEADYSRLGLSSAGPDELVEAMSAHPVLIERPIVIRGHRAVIARPPERLLELLATDPPGAS